VSYEYLSNDEWRDMWLRQAEFNDVSELPKMAPLEVQSRLHGTSGVAAMRGALKFRDVVLDNAEPVSRESKLLDFGCGWGRHIRVFLKDFERANIFAVDIDQSNVSLVNDLLPGLNTITCQENVRLPVLSSSIDRIISFSVFSHISENSARFWLSELARVLKPNCTLVITSWGRSLFDIFERIRVTGKCEYPWERNIDLAFPDKDGVKRKYDGGEYVFGRHGRTGASLDADLYGISLMPRKWIEINTDLHVDRVLDDPATVPQTTFLLRK
jgi:SAM-dependent methyltransferase